MKRTFSQRDCVNLIVQSIKARDRGTEKGKTCKLCRVEFD